MDRVLLRQHYRQLAALVGVVCFSTTWVLGDSLSKPCPPTGTSALPATPIVEKNLEDRIRSLATGDDKSHLIDAVFMYEAHRSRRGVQVTGMPLPDSDSPGYRKAFGLWFAAKLAQSTAGIAVPSSNAQLIKEVAAAAPFMSLADKFRFLSM